VVKNNAIRDLVPLDLMTYDDAVRLALAERAAADERGDTAQATGPVDSAAAHPDTAPR